MNDENSNNELLDENRQCSYFDDKISDIRYKFLKHCDEDKYKNLLMSGYRRFGHVHFVPECKNCDKCVSMRIDIYNFKFSKSQKRILSKNKHTTVYIRRPSITKEHIELFHKYHRYMTDKKGWDENLISADDYISSYVNGANNYGKELLYFVDKKLVGVALCDILDDMISSIYCFYDPDYSELSLGKFSILTQIKMAKEAKIKHIYLGYWIENHHSMDYKSQYTPFEILKKDNNNVQHWVRYQ